LIETIKHVLPTIFFAVPRVYEKMEDKIRESLTNASFLKKRIAKYSMKIGTKYVDNIIKGKNKPFLYPLTNFLMFSKIKKAMGLQECQLFAYGAAPLKKKTLEFFKSIGIPIFNLYGMSESTGPQIFNFVGTPIDLLTAGVSFPGTETRIINSDKDGVGEICFRGRNRFMGYYKNDEATIETIDAEGFLHSGDQGYINKENNLIITGRLKELIVTAGGENVAPLPIEEHFKDLCKIISHVVVLGDDRKYLSALITLKTDLEGNLLKEVLDYLKEIGSSATTILEAINCDKIKFFIQKSIDEVNKKAISRAQLIRKWTILPNEFTIESGELTPTTKVKRKLVSQKYSKVIEKMYHDPKF
jgi:long-chain-fatty-acid--CoA ligase ACSBG